MDKNSLTDVIIDVKAKRDALSLSHESLKQESDRYNKWIILLSLVNGFIETTKLKMKWESDEVALFPIFLSSLIACVSALVKFQDFPSKMEKIVQSESMLTTILTKLRGHTELTDDMKSEYNDALEQLEIAIYPDIRQKFLKQSHHNLLAIMKQDRKYFDEINVIKSPEYVPSDSSSEGTTEKSRFNLYRDKPVLMRSYADESPLPELDESKV
jgi:hypothetical protein